MVMTKLTVKWDGFNGGPGYSNFYARQGVSGSALDSWAAAVSTLLTAAKPYIASVATLTFIPTVVQMDESTGVLITPDTIGTVPSPIVGTGTGNYSSGVGMVIAWRTNSLATRRMMMGRTFLVPLASTAYQNDGTIADAAKNAVNTAANAYVTRVASGALGRAIIWHRNTKFQSDGKTAEVTMATVNDRVQFLTSRRPR